MEAFDSPRIKMDRHEVPMDFNNRSVFHGGRGRGARRQGQRGGRGRGEINGLRGSRERSMSWERSMGRRTCEFDLGGKERDREDQGRITGIPEQRGGRGRLEVEEMMISREDNVRMRTTKPDLGVICNDVSRVMKERLESVVGNTREELQTNMREGMTVLVEAVEEVMDWHLGRVKAVEDTMGWTSEHVNQESRGRQDMEMRTEVRLNDVEDEVLEIRAEVRKESSERKNMDKKTEMRLAEVLDKVHEARAEVDKESSKRKAMEKRTEERLAEMENTVKGVKAEVDKLTDFRNKTRIGESVKEMEAKVSLAMCTLKVSNMDIGMETDNKITIVKEVLREVRKKSRVEEIVRVNRVLKRTRIVVLSQRTQRGQSRGRTNFTIPILFECHDRQDIQELDRILRRAGYVPSFHWPKETLEFIGKIRDKVRKMENCKDSYTTIRPVVRGGRILLRADTKPMAGGRFVLQGIWACPPLNRKLWDEVEGLYTPVVGGRPEGDREYI